MEKIGVGVIGASPLSPGWAVAAHIPAIQALPQFELRAVSTSRRDSADAARNTFDVAAYDNAEDLIRDPAVDLVVVTVRVTKHFPIVEEALRARKMVFCEWPLGANTAEATVLKAKADDAGVRTVVGLQARFSPQVQFAKQLVDDGYIGDVLSTSLVGSASSWGGITAQNNSYIFDDANGVSPLSVSMLHALDALNFILGDLESVSGVSAVRRPIVRIADDDSIRRVTTPDQVAVCGRLKSGAIASIVYRGGQSRGSNLFWEINGSDGDLVFHSNAGNIQVADLRLQVGHGNDNQVTDLSVPDPDKERVPALPGGMSSNVARLYMHFARDLYDGTRTVPDFAHAVTRHELIDHIKRESTNFDICRFDSFANSGSQGPRYES